MTRSGAYIAILLISGCSTVKPYPVCFYDPIAPDTETRKEHAISLEEILRVSASYVNSSPDGRWIYAETNWFQHKNLSKTWPRISCIGKVTSGTEVKRYQDCIYYVEDLLKNKNYIDLDVKANISDSDEAPGFEHVICTRDP